MAKKSVRSQSVNSVPYLSLPLAKLSSLIMHELSPCISGQPSRERERERL